MNIVGVLATRLGKTEEEVQVFLQAYTQVIAVHVVLVGPINTVFGRLAYQKGAATIVSQNPALQELIQSRPNEDQIVNALGQILSEGQHT